MKKKIRGFGSWILVVPIALCLISLAACKGKSAQEKMAEKTVEKILEKTSGGKADVDIKEGRVRIKTEQGESEIASGEKEWPKDLPEAVPQFTMGKVRGVTKSNVQGRKSWNVILEDVENGAVEKYAEVLKSKEWKILQTTTIGEGGMTQAIKDYITILAMFNGKEKSATISVSTQIGE